MMHPVAWRACQRFFGTVGCSGRDARQGHVVSKVAGCVNGCRGMLGGGGHYVKTRSKLTSKGCVPRSVGDRISYGKPVGQSASLTLSINCTCNGGGGGVDQR